MVLLAPLLALALPFLVWPIELFFPYPHIVEEIAKGILIYLIVASADKVNKIAAVAVVGVLFALSESVLYLFNIYLVGTSATLLQRFAVTTGLHVVTSLVIFLPTIKSKKLIVLGVVLAGIIHYYFNFYIKTSVLL